jgi:hypothetical protein
MIHTFLVQWDVVTMKNAFFLLLDTANVAPSSPILVTLMMEAIRSSETSVLTGATQRYVPEDGILHTFHVRWDVLS